MSLQSDLQISQRMRDERLNPSKPVKSYRLNLAPYDRSGVSTPTASPHTGFPPDTHWRFAEPGGPNCSSCAHFDSTASPSCTLYSADTDVTHVSDGYVATSVRASDEAEATEAAFLSQLAHGEYVLEEQEDLVLDDSSDTPGVWKTILRTGTWKTRPGPGGTVLEKPLHVKLSGKTRPGNVVLEDLYNAFIDGAVEHVTVPLSHEDKTHENTGFVRELRIDEDADRPGHHKLLARIHFTEKDVEQKTINGSIANTSVGVNFGYTRKRDGKKYPMVLGHVALTNKPWIDGMEPFGKLAASEQQEGGRLFASFDSNESHPGGEKMGNEDKDTDVVVATPPAEVNLSEAIEAEFGMTAEEIKEALRRSQDQGDRLRMSEVKAQKIEWTAEGVPPAVIEAAEQIMLADDGGTALLLSEEGGQATLTASEIVKRIVDKVPTLDLSEKHTDEDASKNGKPKPNADDEIELSHDVKVAAAELTLENPNMSEEDAIAKAKKALGVEDDS